MGRLWSRAMKSFGFPSTECSYRGTLVRKKPLFRAIRELLSLLMKVANRGQQREWFSTTLWLLWSANDGRGLSVLVCRGSSTHSIQNLDSLQLLSLGSHFFGWAWAFWPWMWGGLIPECIWSPALPLPFPQIKRAHPCLISLTRLMWLPGIQHEPIAFSLFLRFSWTSLWRGLRGGEEWGEWGEWEENKAEWPEWRKCSGRDDRTRDRN